MSVLKYYTTVVIYAICYTQNRAITGSDTAEHVIFYSSTSSNFSESKMQMVQNSANNITEIVIPNNLNGQLLQIRVVLRVLGQDSNVSVPAVLGKHLI